MTKTILQLKRFMKGVKGKDLKAWGQSKAALTYFEGQLAIELTQICDVVRAFVDSKSIRYAAPNG